MREFIGLFRQDWGDEHGLEGYATSSMTALWRWYSGVPHLTALNAPSVSFKRV
jgi:hypothetical protein